MTAPVLKISRPGRHIVVTAPAEVDMVNAGSLSDQLTAICGSPDVITVDMTGTTFCDSAGARALVRAAQVSAASGGELRLAIGNSPVRRILQLNGLDQVASVYPDVRHSLAAPGAWLPGAPGPAV